MLSNFRFIGLTLFIALSFLCNSTFSIAQIADTTQPIVRIFPDRKDTSRIIAPYSLLLHTVTVDEVLIHTTRAGANDPMTYTTMSKDAIAKNNVGLDMPYLLDQTPSVVVTSDGGTGIGYTGIRIRGSDPTRINVTINGIPINDSESQGMYWVDMPDVATSTQDVQIQRGVGASTNGGSAFGASINLRTNSMTDKPYGLVSNSIGSFGMHKHTVQFGTGLIANHWTFEGRLSHILSKGYIDRASSNLKSYFFSGAYSNKGTLIKFNTFSGKEITYQAWGGVPIQYADTNRTYNPYKYDNEVDDYVQTHYQLFLTQQINNQFSANVALHYTKGYGFYEQYRQDDALSKYNLEDVVVGTDTITSTDLIRRKWLNNDFYGVVYSLRYTPLEGKMDMTIGGGWNNYVGQHYGEVIWAKYASNGSIRHRYYDNTGTKLDGNTYFKLNYQAAKGLYCYLDLQHRFVNYSFLGYNSQLANVQQTVSYNFFNPKAGLLYRINEKNQVFASFAVANREPNQDDFTQSTPESRPKPESLYDTELGYKLNVGDILAFNANAYFMYYHNQLILTGNLNDVGAYIRTNVPSSYRTGLELQWKLTPIKNLYWNGNFTYSMNKITNFTESVDVWDDYSQEQVQHKNTDIAFSPNIIAGSELGYNILNSNFGKENAKSHQLQAAWLAKYIGRQYLDNTSNKERSLNGYLVNDLRISYTLRNVLLKEVSLIFMLRNFLNTKYSSNGWTYRFKSVGYNPVADDSYTLSNGNNYYSQVGLYPQAGINFFLGLNIKF